MKSCRSVLDLARAHGVDVPITEPVVRVCHEGESPAHGAGDDEPRGQVGVSDADVGGRHPLRTRGRRAAGTGGPAAAAPVFAAPYHLATRGPGRASPTATPAPTTRPARCSRRRSASWRAGDCRAFATGLAAITPAVLRRAASAGDRVVLPTDGYFRPGRSPPASWPVRHRRAAGATLESPPSPPAALEGVRLVLLETPANPRSSTSSTSPPSRRRATAAGALLAVDNTTATPLGQRPLALGADLIVACGHEGADRALRPAAGLRGHRSTERGRR